MTRLAIFASGRGSNAKAIIEAYQQESELEIALILTNKEQAGVLDLAKAHNIATHVTSRVEFKSEASVLPVLTTHQVDFIVLAGFLWLIPEVLLKAYPNRVVNIHPALLPAYGGKGMHGKNVHQAVKANNEKESGITIHFINSKYDEGEHIFQASVSLSPDDDVDDIASKVLKLEHRYYPVVLKNLLTEK